MARSTSVLGEQAVLERSIDELPVLPSVLVDVMRLDASEDGYFDKLVDLAERDPTFAVRVVHLANSAAYRRRGGPALSVRNAVSRLGSNSTGELLTALSVARVFVPRTPGQRGLWLHSLVVAGATRRLGHMLRLRLDPGMLYLGGLLHDIGRFLMFEASPDELGRIDEIGFASPEALIEAERAVCGTDHARLGALAAESWGLPEWVVRVVAGHHKKVSELEDDLQDAVAALQVADFIGHVLTGVPDEDEVEDATERVLERTSLRLTPVKLRPLIRSAWASATSAMTALGVQH